MSFSLRTFIKGGLLIAIGDMPDFKVILKSAEWLEKGVLTEADLADIQTAIDRQYIEPETPIENEITENEE